MLGIVCIRQDIGNRPRDSETTPIPLTILSMFFIVFSAIVTMGGVVRPARTRMPTNARKGERIQ